MNTPGGACCELLNWDTEFFGRRIARIRGDQLPSEALPEIDRWCGEFGIECLYFLARSDDPDSIRAAGEGGFGMVDVRITLSRSGKLPPVGSNARERAAKIREARSTDLKTLEGIARSAHRNTRFFADPHFSAERAEALYATWIRRECEGHAQKVFVAVSPEDRALGYVTCHREASVARGQIGLIAVDQGAAGRGVGGCLILAALEWFAVSGAEEIRVVTQGNNLSALRLYERNGFVARELQLWFHKWYPTVNRGHD
jgi:dTDP-4-amino-4,6-dideoxy-D-galactose acyltransferase